VEQEKETMNNKLIAITMTLAFLLVGLSGCTDSNETSNNETVEAPLNQLGLSIGDVPDNFVKSNEIYDITPHYIEAGLLKETYALEMYSIRFNESNTNVIDQLIVRYESMGKCMAVFDKIKQESGVNETNSSGPGIGDDSYAIDEHKNISGISYTAFLLVFRVVDIVVILSGVTPHQIDYLAYGRIVENNIAEYIE
jgi:hypothetical protein